MPQPVPPEDQMQTAQMMGEAGAIDAGLEQAEKFAQSVAGPPEEDAQGKAVEEEDTGENEQSRKEQEAGEEGTDVEEV